MRLAILLAGAALLALPFLAGPLASQEKAADKVFKAGAFAQDITPKKFPVSVNGGMQDRQAKGAHDPLHARCLVLDDGAVHTVHRSRPAAVAA